MSYNPGQLRGPDGRWIRVGGTKKVRRSVRKKINKKAHAEFRIQQRKAKRTLPIAKTASRQNRGVGITGLQKNLIPYARISKRSATVGANTGTFIPFTDKRISFGSYLRFETANKLTAVDKAAKSIWGKIAPKGSVQDIVGTHVRKHVKVDNPAIRYSGPGTSSREGVQIRLGTSRKAGPTLIVRRGTHKKASQAGSKSGIKAYDKRMRKIASAGTKVSQPRPTRRRQAARRKKR